MPLAQIPDEMIELLRRGDSRATHPIGSRVKKMPCEEKSVHMDGTLGTVVGNCYHPVIGDAYLVQFDGDAEHVETFITGPKIAKA